METQGSPEWRSFVVSAHFGVAARAPQVGTDSTSQATTQAMSSPPNDSLTANVEDWAARFGWIVGPLFAVWALIASAVVYVRRRQCRLRERLAVALSSVVTIAVAGRWERVEATRRVIATGEG